MAADSPQRPVAGPGAGSGDKSPKVLVILNGSLADTRTSVGGGDQVLFKFIQLSSVRPDLLIPSSALSFVPNHRHAYQTLRNLRPSMLGIMLLFFLRIVQAAWLGLRHREVYDVALAASPFSVDVIPLWLWPARHKGAVIFHILPKRKGVNLATKIRFGIAALEHRITMKLLGRACDFLVAGNDFTRGQLERLVPGKKMYLLDAGFDAAAIDQVAQPSRDRNQACFIGRLVSQKGILDLLPLMEKIAKTNPAFKLLVIGTGPERDFLLAEIARLKLTNIQLTGFVSNEEKYQILKQSEYFFFPSYEEGWGIALAEAMYCECRCVCYELPYYRTVFGDYPAYARLGDREDFLRAFEQCVERSPAQKVFIRQYDDPKIAEKLAEHLRAIAAEPERG